MLVLTALCVLLPLVASNTLETCDMSKTASLLATPLEGSLLDNFGGKNFWFVFVGIDDEDDYQTSEAKFGDVADNAVPVDLVHRKSKGETTEASTVYTLNGDHVLTRKNSIYFFQCSENLIGGYRCQDEVTAGGSGTKYFAWASMDKSAADISGELLSCMNRIHKMDASATFVMRSHP